MKPRRMPNIIGIILTAATGSALADQTSTEFRPAPQRETTPSRTPTPIDSQQRPATAMGAARRWATEPFFGGTQFWGQSVGTQAPNNRYGQLFRSRTDAYFSIVNPGGPVSATISCFNAAGKRVNISQLVQHVQISARGFATLEIQSIPKVQIWCEIDASHPVLFSASIHIQENFAPPPDKQQNWQDWARVYSIPIAAFQLEK